MRRWDGSVQSSNIPTYNKPGITRDNYAMYRCMVIRVIYADNPKNIGKNSQQPEVLYDCIILGGFESGQVLSNCRVASLLSGNFNFEETILQATSKNLNTVPLEQHDGDIVYVQFNQGHDDYPVITGKAKGLSNLYVAKKSDGPRSASQFNGVKEEINNKGDLILTVFGGVANSELGSFKPNTQSVYTQTISATNEMITSVFKSGLSVTTDGKNDKVQVTTSGGAIVTIDGKSKKINIKAGATEIDIDGNSGKISLKGDMVDLGNSVSDFVTMFTQLSTAFNTHSHMYSPGPGGPTPTTPPIAPLLTSVGSQTVKVQP